ncbi:MULTISPECIES: tyrosine-type recombinase/integrase [unclassified Exiguobacterium]|uniref:tyrosine-type recombinase/integrase n=1 Tax=unclassified Exiguobacterium TaxID=2644629 RepID=UPI001BE6B9EF|nr:MULTISPECIES: tyrosine-type recombinase/integrase [unclassified Exiguobacterium]
MDKIIPNNSIPKSEYWDLITSTLSTYEVKDISNDGKVTRRVVNDDYFLVNDVWNIHEIGKIPNFEEQYNKRKGIVNNIYFNCVNPNVNMEIKFVYYNQIFSDRWGILSIFKSISGSLRKLAEYLNERHPNLTSLLDLDIKREQKLWTFWLNGKGEKTIYIKKMRGEEIVARTEIDGFLARIYNTLFQLTDTRDEWEKDRWDVRVLNKKYGIDFNESTSCHRIDFSNIENKNFSKIFKEYIKGRLISGKNFTWGTALSYGTYTIRFLNSIAKQNPKWNDFKKLERKHIETYIEELKEHTKTKLNKKNSNPKKYVRQALKCVRAFIRDLQILEKFEDFAPEEMVFRLIYPEDFPNLPKKSSDEIDYIPDYVLEQLFNNLNDLHPDVQPIVWISFKTGLRLSDTLELTQDCLGKINGKSNLTTDIEKTYVIGHKIPIDDHLADIIAVLIDRSKQNSNDDNNPERYLFVRYRGSRKGRPFSQNFVREELNKLALEKNITDESGNLFHFRPHQFRHTFGVKMINGGADILTVQELLAHASPEMTLQYARLLDDTKRKEFEKVVKQGVFIFDINGEINQLSESEDVPKDILDMLWKDEKLNALDNPYGTCRARVNGNCPLAAEPPCLTANDGKPCFDLAVGMSSFDVKKYELLIETTTKWIEASKEYGREDMVKANEKNLERYQNIYETIKDGNVIFGRFDRMKRQLEREKKKGVKHG